MLRVLRRKNLVGLIIIAILMLSLPAFVHAQTGTAELGIFGAYQVAPGEVVQVPVSVRNVQGLYGLDFTLKFDPALVQVEDDDPSTPGIQAALGNFLDPGLLLFNKADNTQGTYHFAMSQYAPSEPKSGEGIVLILRFRGVAEGTSPLTFTNVQLASGEATKIPSAGVNSTLSVSKGAPTQAATLAVVESTAVIVLDSFTPVPSKSPSPVDTQASFSNTPVPGNTEAAAIKPPVSIDTKVTPASPQASIDAKSTPSGALSSGQRTGEKGSNGPVPFMGGFGWIILIIAVVVIAVGIYLLVSRMKSHQPMKPGHHDQTKP